MLWLLPGVGIIFGGVVITLFLFRAQNEDNIEVEQDNARQVKVEDEYIKKIEEDLKKGDS